MNALDRITRIQVLAVCHESLVYHVIMLITTPCFSLPSFATWEEDLSRWYVKMISHTHTHTQEMVAARKEDLKERARSLVSDLRNTALLEGKTTPELNLRFDDLEKKLVAESSRFLLSGASLVQRQCQV
jgi:hypothetical protein